MMQPHAVQRKDDFVLVVGWVQWTCSGQWEEIPLPERREIVNQMIVENLALLNAMEGEGDHV